MDIPLSTPVCLKSHNGRNLQNDFFFGSARCNNYETGKREQIIFLKTDDNKLIIQSKWNNKNLQVNESGKCVFANYNQSLWEKFDVEVDENGLFYFISCHTKKYMQCEINLNAMCVHDERRGWEQWRIVYLDGINIIPKALKVAATIGATYVGGPIVGAVATRLIPLAMSTFGTVVSGVGTYHAPLAIGGVAAALQVTSVYAKNRICCIS